MQVRVGTLIRWWPDPASSQTWSDRKVSGEYGIVSAIGETTVAIYWSVKGRSVYNVGFLKVWSSEGAVRIEVY